jgi:hydroxypyruvate reductase
MSHRQQSVLIVNQHLDFLAAKLVGSYTVLKAWEPMSDEDYREVVALVVAGEVSLHNDFVAKFPNVKLIACFTSGYDGIDVTTAAKLGISVSHAVDVNSDDVADHALGLLLAWERDLVKGNEMVRNGQWCAQRKTLTRSIEGLRVGIIGMGAIGMAVARRCAAFRLEVAWWGPNPKPQLDIPRRETLMDLAAASDVMIVCSRADPSNRHLISSDVLEALGPQGLLINVARGSLIDEDALISALRCGKLGGAALDVFENEPTDPVRWRDTPNVILTPHTAGATGQAVSRMISQLAANLDSFFDGRELVTPVLWADADNRLFGLSCGTASMADTSSLNKTPNYCVRLR